MPSGACTRIHSAKQRARLPLSMGFSATSQSGGSSTTSLSPKVAGLMSASR